jgi:hydrogenase expression/formation protein HypE
MRAAAAKAGVAIVTGDTKVVPRGKADKIFINTSGIGVFDHDLDIRGSGARPGDKILINGSVGDHGMAVLASREGLELESAIRSDSAPLNHLVADLLREAGGGVHALRDPTRGGVATTLKEIALQSQVDITLEESAIPVSQRSAAPAPSSASTPSSSPTRENSSPWSLPSAPRRPGGDAPAPGRAGRGDHR